MRAQRSNPAAQLVASSLRFSNDEEADACGSIYDPPIASEAGHAEVSLGVGDAVPLGACAPGRAGGAGRSAPSPPRDLFDLEAASDPQISPDGRWIAYVRRSGDIMTDRYRRSIWLIDTNTRRAVAASRPARASRSGRPTATGSPISPPARAGGAQLFVRWMATGQAVAITGLPDAPSSVAWSPDGRQLAYAMFVPDEGARLGPPQPRPEGAQWAEPLQVITAVTYRADGQGYLRPGYSQLFLVSSEGGAPRQLSFGAFNDDGPLSWTPGRAHHPVQRQPLAQLGARAGQQRGLCARHRIGAGSMRSPIATGPTPSRRCRPTGG